MNGLAYGGGFELALACDIVVAVETARFALPEARVGLAALGGGTERLPRAIGLKPAMGMLLTGKAVTAVEGHRLGFVNEVVTEDVVGAARPWADEILACSPMSVRATKAAVLRGMDRPLEVSADAVWKGSGGIASAGLGGCGRRAVGFRRKTSSNLARALGRRPGVHSLSCENTPCPIPSSSSPSPARPWAASRRLQRREGDRTGRHGGQGCGGARGRFACKVEQIYMGCVLPAGLGRPRRVRLPSARAWASTSRRRRSTRCAAPGLQAVMMASDTLAAGSADIVLPGGMESMTAPPYLMNKNRGGARIGHDVIVDSVYMDGLEDAYTSGKLMGNFAEDSAQTYQFTREQQDAYALESLSRALKAIETGAFAAEITPVEVAGRKGTVTVTEDEQPGKAMPEKIPTLKPAFSKDGTITAANASSISDGAAAVVMTRESVAKAMNLPIVARIVLHAAHPHEPGLFTTARTGHAEGAEEGRLVGR